VAMATIAAFSGKKTGQNLSLYSSATIVGRALAPTVGGTAYEAGGYASVYLIAGAAGILALVFAIRFFQKPGEAENKGAGRINLEGAEKIPFFKKLWKLLNYRPLLLVGILEACTYFAYGAFEMLFPLYARQLGMPTGLIGVLLGIQLVGIILFKPIFGRASDKFGRLPMMVTGLLACSLSFFLLAILQSSIAIIPLIFTYGLGFALITASTSALAADVARAGQLGASLGILSTLMDVGQTMGPPVIGMISDMYSYAAGIVTLGAVLLLAALGCIAALARQRHPALPA
jgi:MFS family permease